MTEEELQEVLRGVRYHWGDSSRIYTQTMTLVNEIRRLNGVVHDMGLPDANDFPHPTGGIL